MALVPVSQIMAKIRAAQADALREAARVVGEASDKNAPKDTRDLVESRRNRVEGRRASITYGEGLSDPRAVINHEKTEIHHDTGGAKYLERAMASELPKIRRVIAEKIKKVTR